MHYFLFFIRALSCSKSHLAVAFVVDSIRPLVTKTHIDALYASAIHQSRSISVTNLGIQHSCKSELTCTIEAMEFGYHPEQCMCIFRGICTTALGTSNHEFQIQYSLHTYPPKGSFLKHIPTLLHAWTVAELTCATDVKSNTMLDSVIRIR